MCEEKDERRHSTKFNKKQENRIVMAVTKGVKHGDRSRHAQIKEV